MTQNQEYKSVEQEIFELNKPYIKFCEGLIKTTYGLCASTLRIPTAIRKLIKKQSYFVKGDSVDCFEIWGNIGGVIPSVYLVSVGCMEVIKQTDSGNYLPLVAVIVTNLLSLSYEGGKRGTWEKQSKLENELNRPIENK